MDSVLSESIWQWDPKVGDLYQATTKPWETVVEVGSSPDVQIALSQLGIGAKDSPNHLVAGFPRSFPQDSWSWGNGYEKRYIYFCVIVQKTRKNHKKKQKKPRRRLCRVKKCMRGTRFLLLFWFLLGSEKECKGSDYSGNTISHSPRPILKLWSGMFSFLLTKKNKKKTLISTACLRPFQKAMCFSAHPPGGFLCRWLCKKNNKKNIHTYTPKHPKHVFCVCVCVCVVLLFYLFEFFFGHGKKEWTTKKTDLDQNKVKPSVRLQVGHHW